MPIESGAQDQHSTLTSRTAFFTRSDEGYFQAEEFAQHDKKRNVSSTENTEMKSWQADALLVPSPSVFGGEGEDQGASVGPAHR